MKLKVVVAACMLASALSAGGHVNAEWQPKRPIQIVVGFSPGGGTDLIARAIATASQEIIPVPVIVVNRPGASGAIAAEFVAKAPADGHTLLMAGGSESTSLPNHQKVSYSLKDSFRPVVHVVRMRIMITVKADSPFKSLKEIVSFAKANPGKLSYGSSGAGSLYHSVMLLFNKAAGIDTLHVPYKGGAPVLAALVGDEVRIGIAGPDEAKTWIDTNRIRPLAVASNDRFAGLPDVPTLKELGYDVYIENMKGLVGPAGLSDDVYAYLHSRFKRAIESSTFKSLADRGNFETTYMDGPAFGKTMENMSNAIASALKK